MVKGHARSKSSYTAAEQGGPSTETTAAVQFSTSAHHHGDGPSSARRRATVTGPPPDYKPSWPIPEDDGSATPLARLDTISRDASNVNLALVARLLAESELDTKTYGLTESRDGFFDAFFLEPPSAEYSELMKSVEPTLPDAFRTKGSFSGRGFLVKQWIALRSMMADIFKTRSGILLCKSFLAFYIAYILCLIPSVRGWLGKYNYIMVVSTILNHPGRTVGSQLDGAILTTIGTAAGLGWGAVGLLLSTSTGDARAGHGAVLALFLGLFMAAIAFLRSYLVRMYQLVICGGMAIIYTCLADVDGQRVKWEKIYAYAIPWMLGQAIAFVVCVAVYPDAGARPLAEVYHRAFGVMLDGLVIPRLRGHEVRQRLAQAYFELSTAHRDMKLDITIARFRAHDTRELRDLMHGVIRGLLSMKTDNELFEESVQSRPPTRQSHLSTISDASHDEWPEFHASLGTESARILFLSNDEAVKKGVGALQGPTLELVATMFDGLRACDAALMDVSGCRSSMGPPLDVSSDVAGARARIVAAMKVFDETETTLSGSQELRTYSPEIIRLLDLARSVRMTADPILKLLARIRVQQAQSDRIWIDPPAYAFWKSLNRTNAQVRHDRGTVTPSSYSQTFARIYELVGKLKAQDHKPVVHDLFDEHEGPEDTTSEMNKNFGTAEKPQSMRHKTWRFLRHLQGFEGKYALRVVVVTGMLSIPGYLHSSTGWWNAHDAWWAVCMAWLMSHTMVGGSLNDLVMRSLCVILSALWSGFAFAARDGNPFVMAAFALLYMFPMMYRYTRSNHARSGLAACLSFTVVSLGMVTSSAASPPDAIRGLSFLVGVVAATLVNWLLFPFVARHQLRKSVSSMLFFLSVLYRDMVTKYVYYEHTHPPTRNDVHQSESLESHLREGFIRMRQLLHLSLHELRLRAPFDPVPYLALIDLCEAFFDDLITVRQAALFYSAEFLRKGEAARLVLGYRRDAVAAVLTNLYVLSGAMSAGNKVPRYLPSAAVSRKRLLDKMAEVEADLPDSHDADSKTREKWALIYRYSYNESLTRCIAHLEAMEKWTKLILGERGFEDEYRDEDEDEDEVHK